MPGKGRRMASRQAELGRRRRRQNRGGNTAVAERTGSVGPGSVVAATAVEDIAASPPGASPRPVQQPREPVADAYRPGSRSRFDRPAAYNYVKPEMRRILIMSGVLLAGLIGLSFFI